MVSISAEMGMRELPWTALPAKRRWTSARSCVCKLPAFNTTVPTDAILAAAPRCPVCKEPMIRVKRRVKIGDEMRTVWVWECPDHG